MSIERKVRAAKVNEDDCNALIREYRSFIASQVNKTTGRFITEHDDEMSIAMIAFSEAIQKYDRDKGSFLSFAAMIIKSRIIDYLRSENKNVDAVPFSSLSRTDNDGDITEFDIEDNSADGQEICYEIEALSQELNRHSITFTDLSRVSPKSKKTKAACLEVINCIANQPILAEKLKSSGTLPINTILDNVKANRKVIERHRKYIIAGVIILTGDYGGIAEYLRTAKKEASI